MRKPAAVPLFPVQPRSAHIFVRARSVRSRHREPPTVFQHQRTTGKQRRSDQVDILPRYREEPHRTEDKPSRHSTRIVLSGKASASGPKLIKQIPHPLGRTIGPPGIMVKIGCQESRFIANLVIPTVEQFVQKGLELLRAAVLGDQPVHVVRYISRVIPRSAFVKIRPVPIIRTAENRRKARPPISFGILSPEETSPGIEQMKPAARSAHTSPGHLQDPGLRRPVRHNNRRMHTPTIWNCRS